MASFTSAIIMDGHKRVLLEGPEGEIIAKSSGVRED